MRIRMNPSWRSRVIHALRLGCVTVGIVRARSPMPPPSTPVVAPPDVDRRTAIATVLAAFGALYLSRWNWWTTDNSALYAFAARLVRVLGLADQSIGDFLSATDDSDLPSLVERLLRKPADRFVSMSDTDLRDHLRQKVVLDFQAGRIQVS